MPKVVENVAVYIRRSEFKPYEDRIQGCSLIIFDNLRKETQDAVLEVFKTVPCMEIQYVGGAFERKTGDDVFAWLDKNSTNKEE
jgi:hypothetical protein